MSNSNYFVQLDKLRKKIGLYILQDKKIEFDWSSPIRSVLLRGRHTHITLKCLDTNLEYLNSTQRVLREELRYTAFIFIHSQDVIHSEVFLSRDFQGEWRRVKILNQKNRNNFVNYMMYVPELTDLGKSQPFNNHLECIASLYNVSIVVFIRIMQSLPSIDNPSISKDFLNGVKVHSVMNLMYLKEIGYPCILFPEEVGIRLEFRNFAYKTALNVPVARDSLSSHHCLLESRYFINKGLAARGTSSKCYIFEAPDNFPTSSKKIFLKEVLTKTLSSAEYSSDVFLSPRTQILEEIAIMVLLNNLNIPYIVRQFTLRVPKENGIFVRPPLILYDCEDEETKFYLAMEFINGTDICDVDVASLDDLTKFLIVLHVTETLNVLHRNGFVHNDLHLGNMRLESSTNRIVILDFGSCEKISEENIKKDVKYLFKLIRHLYSIQATGRQQYNNVPCILRPIIEDAQWNYRERRYNTVAKILDSFDRFPIGTVLNPVMLDFGFFLKYIGFYEVPAFQDFLKLKRLYEETALPLFEEDRNIQADKLYKYNDLLLVQEKVLQIYLEKRKEAFRVQKICVQRVLSSY